MSKCSAPRGRPRLGCVAKQFRITLTLHTGEDDTLIEIIESIPKGRRAMVLKALILSDGIKQNRVTINQVETIDETIEEMVF